MRNRTCRTFVLALLTAMASFGRVQSCSADTWVDSRQVGPFHCWAEFSLAEYGGLFGELVQIQDHLGRYLRIPPSSEPIEILLFRSKESYRRYLAQNLPNVPYRRALYVKTQGPGTVFAYRSRELQTDLRHECTHALLHAVLPMVPLWLDEGLAEYFEVPYRERAFGNPYLGSLRWRSMIGNVPRIESLEKKAEISQMSQSDYRSSWAWVHFMLHGPREAHQELVGFLGDIRASTPPGLLSERLHRRLPSTGRRFSAHFKSWKR